MAAGRVVALVAVVAVAARLVAAADGNTPCLDPPGNNLLANQVADQIEKVRPMIPEPVGPLPPIAFDVNTEALVLNGTVTDTSLHNIADFILCRLNLSVGISQKFDILFKLDDIRLDGFYDIDGLAVSLFPIFGTGNYSLDMFNAGFEAKGAVSLNILSGKFKVKDLELNLFYDSIEIFMECILGCGNMADFVNDHLSDIATAIVQAVWDHLAPTISAKLEEIINAVLAGETSAPLYLRTELAKEFNGGRNFRLGSGVNRDMGNANLMVSMALKTANRILRKSGLDPAILPEVDLPLSQATASLANGTLTGLASLERTGTCTLDTVADWTFLYANVGLGLIQGQYSGLLTSSDNITDTFEVSASIDGIELYLTARKDSNSGLFDLDQFELSNMGKPDIRVTGLGPLAYMAGELSQVVLALFEDTLQALISNEVKAAIQQGLNEQPWA